MSDIVATNQTILVVGGGISGMTAALEAAEVGKQVIVIEKTPSVGGRVTKLYKYFPKLCFPTCGLEINQRRMAANKNITVLTMAEVTDLQGEAGNYSATIKTSPRYVNAKDINEAAYDGGAGMIVTPCPVCQMNVEVYQEKINVKYGAKFNIPVTYYSTLMSVAYGKNGKESGLNGQIINAKQLEAITSK